MRLRSGRAGSVTVLGVLALAQQVAFSQSLLDFDEWMQIIDRRGQSLQRELAARDVVAADADARKIGELYESMEAFFTRGGTPAEAARLSRESRDLAAKVLTSMDRNDFASASEAALSIARACRTCHTQFKPLE
jgi:hypothetical protein